MFILATGWRSGSTLLQRLVVSSGEVLLWGEPYGRAGVIPSMTRMLHAFKPGWPAEGALLGEGDVDHAALAQRWIANLYPEPAALRAGLRAMMDHWLRIPAQERGFERFGLKEVRFSVFDAMVLHWLYPDARFVILVRNPWDAWASMKGHRWILRWPDQVVSKVDEFVQVWSGIWRSFLAWDHPAVVRIRFEDLRTQDLSPLEQHLQIGPMDLTVRQSMLRGITKPPLELESREIDVIGSTWR